MDVLSKLAARFQPSATRRKRKLDRISRRRQLAIETLDKRLVLSGVGVPFDATSNDDVIVNPTGESMRDRHQLFCRLAMDNFDPNALAENHDRLDEGRVERIPPLESSQFELGELQGNQVMQMPYPAFIPSTPGGNFNTARAAEPGREAEEPRCFFNYQGPSADDYVYADQFLDIGDITDYLPELDSWSYGDDVHLFYPDPLDNSVVTDTEDHIFTETPDPATTIDYDIRSIITVTTTLAPGGEWTYEEVLATTYTIVTTIDTADIDRTLTQWGTYNYTFTASSDLIFASTLENYGIDTSGTDSFSDLYTETMLVDNLPTQYDTGQYDYVAGGLKTHEDHFDGALIQNVVTYTESGNLIKDVDFASDGIYSYLKTAGDLALGDGMVSNEDGALIETHDESNVSDYIGNGTIAVNNVWDKTKVGIRSKDGLATGSYTFNHDGQYLYDDEYPDGGGIGFSTVHRHEIWDEALLDTFGYSYVDDITYNADDTYDVRTQETGDADGVYDTEGEHWFNWHEDLGNYMGGWGTDGSVEDYSEHSKDNTNPPLPNTSHYTYHYDDDIVRTYDENDQQIDINGTSHETGDVRSVHNLNILDGTFTFNENDVAFDYTSTAGQTDNWVELVSDGYNFDYDDLISYLPDSTISHNVIENGGGGGFWNLQKDGIYAWTANASDGTWWDTYSSNYDRIFADWYGYGYVNLTTTTYDANWQEIGKVGTIDTNAGATGARDVDSGWDFSYGYDNGNGITKTIDNDWVENVKDDYVYSNHSVATYNADNSQQYTVLETGTGDGYADYDSSTNQVYNETFGDASSGGLNHVDSHQTLSDYEDYDYTYSEDWLTLAYPNLGEIVSATIIDQGTSSGIVEWHDWGTERMESWFNDPMMGNFSSMNETIWDILSADSYAHAYDYTTTVTPGPIWFMHTVTVTGSETTTRSGTWSYTITQNWSDSFGGSGSTTDTDSGSYSDSSTITDEFFNGPRAGRDRIYGWCLGLIRLARHGRFDEIWDAEAKSPGQ